MVTLVEEQDVATVRSALGRRRSSKESPVLQQLTALGAGSQEPPRGHPASPGVGPEQGTPRGRREVSPQHLEHPMEDPDINLTSETAIVGSVVDACLSLPYIVSQSDSCACVLHRLARVVLPGIYHPAHTPLHF